MGAHSRILLVDDSEDVLRAYGRLLEREGYKVDRCPDGAAAEKRLHGARYDVILSDVSMPNATGVDLLRAVRRIDLDVPVLLMTGLPTIDDAIAAVELGALRYLRKPVDADELIHAVEDACRVHDLARLKRAALQLAGENRLLPVDRAGLESQLGRAFDGISMVYQPIVSIDSGEIHAFEALVRGGDPLLMPGDLIDAAERLGRLRDLGRLIRARVAEDVARMAPLSVRVFVNLHASDLEDEELFDPGSPLSKIAARVVLELTERASMAGVSDVQRRIQRLKAMGFGLAIDDLGSGYSGLAALTQLDPDVVKLDMSLIRGVDSSETSRKLVGSMATLCKELRLEVVVEGVETEGERDALTALGCRLQQGFLHARPQLDFVAPPGLRLPVLSGGRQTTAVDGDDGPGHVVVLDQKRDRAGNRLG